MRDNPRIFYFELNQLVLENINHSHLHQHQQNTSNGL